MEISAEGCSAFSAAIPLLLMAGYLRERNVKHVALMHLATRVLLAGITAFALFGLLISLVGASRGGLDSGLGMLVTMSCAFLAGGMFTDVVADLFRPHLHLTDDEIEEVWRRRRTES